jgi:hypothetical protein
LKEKSHPVESVAQEPERLARQAPHEAEPDGLLGSLLRGRMVLEDGRNPVGDGTGERKQDDQEHAAPDLVVN